MNEQQAFRAKLNDQLRDARQTGFRRGVELKLQSGGDLSYGEYKYLVRLDKNDPLRIAWAARRS